VSAGSASLPANHPPVTLPDDVKSRISELAAKAEAAPQDLNAWKTLAQVQFRASQFDSSYRSAALTSYQHVLELAPQDLEALRGVGNVYYDLEEYARAIEHYEKYLALQPQDSNVRTDLGTMYLYSGKPDRAVAEYQAVVTKNPTFFQAHFNLGIAYQEKGDKEKAVRALTRAKELATDQEVRQRVDQLLTQISPGVKPASIPAPEGTAPSLFQSAVEQLFRGHEIMGPKVSRIEWSSPTRGRVHLHSFPMSGMPPEVRERFIGRMRTKINEAKVLHSLEGEVKIEMVDADTGQVMETITA
jgi:tetratricopeptide (TPR) repeat protein